MQSLSGSHEVPCAWIDVPMENTSRHLHEIEPRCALTREGCSSWRLWEKNLRHWFYSPLPLAACTFQRAWISPWCHCSVGKLLFLCNYSSEKKANVSHHCFNIDPCWNTAYKDISAIPFERNLSWPRMLWEQAGTRWTKKYLLLQTESNSALPCSPSSFCSVIHGRRGSGASVSLHWPSCLLCSPDHFLAFVQYLFGYCPSR